MLRCKRQSQLPRYRSPVRPHVLHSSPHGYGEGDLDTIADRTNPSTRDALGTTKIASGQHQGCSLMYRQPVSLHELHPAHDGTVRRVDRYDFNSFPVTTGDEVRLDLAVRKGRQHPGVLAGLSLQHRLLLPKVQPLNHQRLPDSTRVPNHARHRVSYQCLRLMVALPVGHQRHPPRFHVVATRISLD